jgi:hypothetical protein
MKEPASISVVLFLSLLSATGSAKAPAGPWFSVDRSSLCVTEGEIKVGAEDRLSVDAPKMRAYLNRWTAQAIEARFTYLGPTAVVKPLGSGTVRQQFGLKLRAQDACNLVYAMWRFEPESTLVVSVKSNTGEHTSAECGNRGYRNIKAQKSSPVPRLNSGDRHVLRAAMNGADMSVFVDNTLVWQGNVGPGVLSLNGPVGIRSDNARLELEILARWDDGNHPSYVAACKSGAGESD